jgi:hypothetical protein
MSQQHFWPYCWPLMLWASLLKRGDRALLTFFMILRCFKVFLMVLHWINHDWTHILTTIAHIATRCVYIVPQPSTTNTHQCPSTHCRRYALAPSSGSGVCAACASRSPFAMVQTVVSATALRKRFGCFSSQNLSTVALLLPRVGLSLVVLLAFTTASPDFLSMVEAGSDSR